MDKAITPHDIKLFLIEALAIEGIQPEDIGDDEPLFVEGLALDSVDGLELDIALRKKYKIHTDNIKPTNNNYLATAKSIAIYFNNNGLNSAEPSGDLL